MFTNAGGGPSGILRRSVSDLEHPRPTDSLVWCPTQRLLELRWSSAMMMMMMMIYLRESPWNPLMVSSSGSFCNIFDIWARRRRFGWDCPARRRRCSYLPRWGRTTAGGSSLWICPELMFGRFPGATNKLCWMLNVECWWLMYYVYYNIMCLQWMLYVNFTCKLYM